MVGLDGNIFGGVDDKQNCDREEGQDGWRLVSFEQQRPITLVAVPAGVADYDVTIRSSAKGPASCYEDRRVSPLTQHRQTCGAPETASN